MHKEPMIRRMGPTLSNRFLGTFAKFRKETISYVIFVCLSVRPPPRPPVSMEQFDSHRMDFHEVLYLYILKNLSRIYKFH